MLNDFFNTLYKLYISQILKEYLKFINTSWIFKYLQYLNICISYIFKYVFTYILNTLRDILKLMCYLYIKF